MLLVEARREISEKPEPHSCKYIRSANKVHRQHHQQQRHSGCAAEPQNELDAGRPKHGAVRCDERATAPLPTANARHREWSNWTAGAGLCR